MGYYTHHKLEIVKGDNELISELRDFSEDANYALEDDGDTAESCKWYDHESDLKNFSALRPDALFKLSGEGEEAGDLWIEYYQNGKMQLCKGKITFDEFDCNKLV